MATIARLLGLAQRPLYRRLEHLMQIMRRELEARGVTREHVSQILGEAAPGLRPVLDMAAARKRLSRPSVE